MYAQLCKKFYDKAKVQQNLENLENTNLQIFQDSENSSNKLAVINYIIYFLS